MYLRTMTTQELISYASVQARTQLEEELLARLEELLKIIGNMETQE
jgi:hypothetical protein